MVKAMLHFIWSELMALSESIKRCISSVSYLTDEAPQNISDQLPRETEYNRINAKHVVNMVPNPTRQVWKAFSLKVSPRRQGSARNCLGYVFLLWVAAAVVHITS
jgi:hypothetical protein